MIKYKLILEKNEYALIQRGEKLKEYAVVNGLNKERGEWAWTCSYYAFEYDGKPISNCTKAEALCLALEVFRMRTEPNYIPRFRLEELATLFKDGLLDDDKETAMEYFDSVCEMTDEEKIFFGIETESEEE